MIDNTAWRKFDESLRMLFPLASRSFRCSLLKKGKHFTATEVLSLSCGNVLTKGTASIR